MFCAVERVVPADENLCLRVDFWGKMRVGDQQMHISCRPFLNTLIVNNCADSVLPLLNPLISSTPSGGMHVANVHI